MWLNQTGSMTYSYDVQYIITLKQSQRFAGLEADNCSFRMEVVPLD